MNMEAPRLNIGIEHAAVRKTGRDGQLGGSVVSKS